MGREGDDYWFPQLSPRVKSLIIFLLIFEVPPIIHSLDFLPKFIGGAFFILSFRRRSDESVFLRPNIGKFYSNGLRVWRDAQSVIEEMGLTRFYIFSQKEAAQKMLDESMVPVNR